jgi:mono/diheme cytochrome c family protein
MSSHRVVVGFSVVLAVAACAGMPSIAPVDPPHRSSFDAALIARGAQLAAIGNCNVCHTALGGKSYAGGRPLKTPFGTIYGTNITPDPDTGIGRWSQNAFARAMREGLDREGRHLYPAFPYEYFTKMTDEDVKALYAFMMTRDPVQAVTPPNELAFPFNVRGLIGGWKLLYFERGVFRADPAQTAQWNRGAYLVDGIGHCGACHTPRNRLGAEKKREYLAGGEVEDWHAPALNAASPAPVPWTTGQLYKYLRTGLDDLHAIAAGPMAPVVRNLESVSKEDVQAIATYIAASIGTPSPDHRRKADEALTHARHDEAVGARIVRMEHAGAAGNRTLQSGAGIYAGSCAACHDVGRQASSGSGLYLALGTAMTIPTSANLVRIVMEGIVPPNGEPGRWMPGFADELTDEQIADLVTYIRAYFGRAPAWVDVNEEITKVRRTKAKLSVQ